MTTIFDVLMENDQCSMNTVHFTFSIVPNFSGGLIRMRLLLFVFSFSATKDRISFAVSPFWFVSFTYSSLLFVRNKCARIQHRVFASIGLLNNHRAPFSPPLLLSTFFSSASICWLLPSVSPHNSRARLYKCRSKRHLSTNTIWLLQPMPVFNQRHSPRSLLLVCSLSFTRFLPLAIRLPFLHSSLFYSVTITSPHARSVSLTITN